MRFGEATAPVVIGSDSFVIVRVPEKRGGQRIDYRQRRPRQRSVDLRHRHPDRRQLHPVSNPVIDRYGNIYTTFSGSPGQKTPVSIYKIDTSYHAKPLVSDLMNATGLGDRFRRRGVRVEPA